MSAPAVKAVDLTRKFGTFTAVDRVSFEVARGEIYGFLGANGAGKSTTIRMLCGILEPTSGAADVAGYSVIQQPEEVKKRIGYMSQKFSLYSNLTVRENLTFFAGIYGISPEKIRERQNDVMGKTDLAGLEDRAVSVLPGGVKQRVALACAIVHEPQVLFLDEPTAGVDPLLRRRFWSIIDQLSGSGTTVFVTTHYMDEVEHCHRVALMSAGRIIKEGTIPYLKSSAFPLPILEIETENVIDAYRYLSGIDKDIAEVSMHGSLLHVAPSTDVEAARRHVEKMLKEKKVAYRPPHTVEPTMEDVFVKVVRE